ncbi:MAG: histone deacetylase family protein [Gammaproteobacteria bacterium]|nr:histone deacetylase family protein [Gammaproteobacteria bacterium]MDH5618378.1 histone deacetylase family protein [Gammaproteobacteria bacterium]
MRTAYITHPDCRNHDTGPGHPENASRLYAIEDRFVTSGLDRVLRYVDAPLVTDEQLLRVHPAEYVDTIRAAIPDSGYARLDPDTVVGPKSLQAAYRAAGAAVAAVDLVMSGEMESAFCGVRPPGHHAERTRSMGFCMFDNIAVAAAHALAEYGLERVAIVDFDVHHGNGTEDIFRDEDRVLFCSTFEHPFYPFTPLLGNTANRISVPLDANAKSEEFRAAVTEHWLPALSAFRPEFVFVSAGFDAHRDDDMSHVALTDADFRWVSERIVDIAKASASGRIVSVLEGGYELNSLARCVEAHIRVLMGIHS